MKYYIIAGEASGDLHGSNLIKELRLLDKEVDIRCWGGDYMEQAGATLVKHYRDLAFMGFAEVVMNLRTILRNLSFCKEDIARYQPDVLILVDYPGFNLRIAEWAKSRGMKVVFYISPQVWAWKEGRVKKMKQHIDLMLVILPFEKDYFKNRWQWDVQYVGHPLVRVIDQFKASPEAQVLLTDNNTPLPASQKLVALLPGSRKQEILKKLPVMLEVSKQFPDCTFVVAKAPGQEDVFYADLLAPYKNVLAVRNQTYALLAQSNAALVTSGTATLETALFGVPEAVCYKGSNISYQIAKRLIKVKYISLVNLILDKLVVKELIQNDLTVANASTALKNLLYNVDKQAQLQRDYQELKTLLSAGGNASANAARAIVDFMGGL
ncbi:lipid-A-disaccharide synthase [Deminuibacter soli]|uniref:Lipid-A-disaccharide synthase n=1 Tax=Deminuibacter soli TaxID=2291815 RepID=A0A3E1NL92_9BACT|nr:lipid-A-disaccharide synthase [Deminuibacter soli]RFM28614.1 lipid-A-disaccharide synthase [Deminuibacter soli]